MTFNRNRLSVSEVASIGNAMAELGNFVDREILKNSAILRYCSDIEVPDRIDYEEYQKWIDDGVIDSIYANIENDGDCDAQCKSIIDNRNYEMIVTIRKDIDMFLEKANEAIDSYTQNAQKNGTDLESLISKMKEVV